MKIHHFRNATMVIETGQHFILVDPMLGDKGSMSTLTLFRFKAQRNPIVPLQQTSQALLEKVTHCLITHRHPDHLDKAGIQFLKTKQIPVYCSHNDSKALKKLGLNIVQEIDYWKKSTFLGGTIEGIPAKHGYGFAATIGGKVMGFYIDFPNQPSIYISSDTVYTPAVHKVLTSYQPQVAVVAGGTAQLDLFQPLLMHKDDITKFIKNAPHQVLINHLEAVNHCPTTRTELRALTHQNQWTGKVFIPDDGTSIALS